MSESSMHMANLKHAWGSPAFAAERKYFVGAKAGSIILSFRSVSTPTRNHGGDTTSLSPATCLMELSEDTWALQPDICSLLEEDSSMLIISAQGLVYAVTVIVLGVGQQEPSRNDGRPEGLCVTADSRWKSPSLGTEPASNVSAAFPCRPLPSPSFGRQGVSGGVRGAPRPLGRRADSSKRLINLDRGLIQASRFANNVGVSRGAPARAHVVPPRAPCAIRAREGSSLIGVDF